MTLNNEPGESLRTRVLKSIFLQKIYWFADNPVRSSCELNPGLLGAASCQRRHERRCMSRSQ